MNIYKIKLYSIIFLSFIGIVNAGVYDTFSKATLNEHKWIEEGTYERLPSIEEHFVDSTKNKYHQAQINIQEAETRLSSVWLYQSGETLDYDIYYISGTGNRISRVWINDKPADRFYLDSGQAPDYMCPGAATCGDIGYWNGVSSFGSNALGKYHVRILFYQNYVNIKFTDPTGITYDYPSPLNFITAPYKVSISTRTGNNGQAHFDYDNFIIKELKNKKK